MLDSLATLWDGIKRIREVSAKLRDAELQAAIAELSLSASDLKIELAEMREANSTLRGELARLQTSANLRAQLQLRRGMYFLTEPPVGFHEGPYCTTCFDDSGKLISVTNQVSRHACFVCNSYFLG